MKGNIMQINLIVDKSGNEISLGEFNEGLRSRIAVSHIIEYNGQRLAVQIADFEDDDLLFS